MLLSFALLVLAHVGVQAVGLSTGYNTEGLLAAGTIVSYDPENENLVYPAKVDQNSTLLGVVTSESEALVEIKREQNTVQVATAGTARVLVTAFDGEIKAGSFVAPGSLAGIGSLAGDQEFILGVAREGFSGSGDNIIGTVGSLVPGFESDTVPLSTPVGLIEVEVNVVTNPNLQQGLVDSIGKYFADRGTGPIRFFLAFIVFVAAIDVVGAIMYGSTRGSLISIGRNPLASKPVYVGLLGVSTLSVVILIVSLVAMFFLLR